MKILYLYDEVMGYTTATLRELAEKGHEIHVIYRDHNKLTPYQPPPIPNVFLYKRSGLTTHRIWQLAEKLKPAVTVISGWVDRGYLQVAKQLRSKGCAVVVGLDSHWRSTWRQRFAALLGGFGFFSRLYSHAWVAGPCQYEYARRLGFKKQDIVFDLYSADLRLFDSVYSDNVQAKAIHYPRRFLFVGRFEPVKGLEVLLAAWRHLGSRRDGWDLHLIGHGSLKADIAAESGVVIKDFMQPAELSREIAQAGCFILPSNGEPWGVVVHEFAAGGLPLIVSDSVGAASTFLVPGMNGFTFPAGDAKALAARMFQLIRLSDQQLHSMAVHSHQVSRRITPQSSANNLLSVANPERWVSA
jgi:glycosyltransferase involved in cell wall biosynthesis